MLMWKVISNDIITFLFTQEQDNLFTSPDLVSAQLKETQLRKNF